MFLNFPWTAQVHAVVDGMHVILQTENPWPESELFWSEKITNRRCIRTQHVQKSGTTIWASHAPAWAMKERWFSGRWLNYNVGVTVRALGHSLWYYDLPLRPQCLYTSAPPWRCSGSRLSLCRRSSDESGPGSGSGSKLGAGWWRATRSMATAIVNEQHVSGCPTLGCGTYNGSKDAVATVAGSLGGR
jgi:hypothetical protein